MLLFCFLQLQTTRTKYLSLLLWYLQRELWWKSPAIILYPMLTTSSGTFISQDMHRNSLLRAQGLLNRDATTWPMNDSLHHCSSLRCRWQMLPLITVLWKTQRQRTCAESSKNKFTPFPEDWKERTTTTLYLICCSTRFSTWSCYQKNLVQTQNILAQYIFPYMENIWKSD